jgi:hypothetical protein
MEQYQNWKTTEGHSPHCFACGCLTAQSVDEPIIFTSIMTPDDISDQIARLHRIRAVADEYDA